MPKITSPHTLLVKLLYWSACVALELLELSVQLLCTWYVEWIYLIFLSWNMWSYFHNSIDLRPNQYITTTLNAVSVSFYVYFHCITTTILPQPCIVRLQGLWKWKPPIALMSWACRTAHRKSSLSACMFHHDNVIKWKHFRCYWPFVRGIHRSRLIRRTKASDAEFWYFLWPARE